MHIAAGPASSPEVPNSMKAGESTSSAGARGTQPGRLSFAVPTMASASTLPSVSAVEVKAGLTPSRWPSARSTVHRKLV